MSPFEDESLKEIGEHILELVRAGEYSAIADSYGYALSFDRSPSEVIESDIEISLRDIGATFSDLKRADSEIVLNQFSCESNIKFDVLVEISVLILGKGGVLIELMKNKDGKIYLEQISSFSAG